MSHAQVEPGTDTGLRPISAVSRREAAVQQIRRGIVLGVLRPGERLTEIGLASSLEVSRATVREALSQLAQEGLLIAEPYRGLHVAELDAAAVRDLARTRVALDRLALEAIIADPSGTRMAALHTAWQTYEDVIDDPDPLARHDAHLAFHEAIWSAAENVLLDQLWPVVRANLTLALAEEQRARPNPKRARRIHARLVAAVTARDLDRVEAMLREHTLDTAELLARTLEDRANRANPKHPENKERTRT